MEDQILATLSYGGIHWIYGPGRLAQGTQTTNSLLYTSAKRCMTPEHALKHFMNIEIENGALICATSCLVVPGIKVVGSNAYIESRGAGHPM